MKTSVLCHNMMEQAAAWRLQPSSPLPLLGAPGKLLSQAWHSSRNGMEPAARQRLQICCTAATSLLPGRWTQPMLPQKAAPASGFPPTQCRALVQHQLSCSSTPQHPALATMRPLLLLVQAACWATLLHWLPVPPARKVAWTLNPVHSPACTSTLERWGSQGLLGRARPPLTPPSTQRPWCAAQHTPRGRCDVLNVMGLAAASASRLRQAARPQTQT